MSTKGKLIERRAVSESENLDDLIELMVRVGAKDDEELSINRRQERRGWYSRPNLFEMS